MCSLLNWLSYVLSWVVIERDGQVNRSNIVKKMLIIRKYLASGELFNYNFII